MSKPFWRVRTGFFDGSSARLMGQSGLFSNSLRFILLGSILSIILCLMVSCTGVTKSTSSSSGGSTQTPATPPPSGGGGSTPPPNPTPVPIVPAPIPPSSSNIVVFPSAIAVPAGTFQTVSAIVSDVDNKRVTWSVDGGALVGANPCTDAMTAPCTVALYSKVPGTYHVTATSVADAKAQATATIVVTAGPTPVTTHPRLYFTQSDIASLRTKAAAGGDVWSALQTNANNGAKTADAGWSTANGGGGYTCDGGNGQPSLAYINSDESAGWGGPQPFLQSTIFAMMANVDIDASRRARWQCRAHDTYLYSMKEILKNSCGAGLCNPNILNGNQGGDWGAGIGLTLDWIYDSFSASEKATIMAAHRKAAQMIRTQTGITSAHPIPVGTINDPSLAVDSSYATVGVNTYVYLRQTGNNYYSLHIAQLVAMAAAWDPADDPTQNNCAGGRDQVCADGSANSMHAYLKDAMGAYLYLMWLNYDEPSVTTSAYNVAFGSSMDSNRQCSASDIASIPAPCYGNGRGGLSHEGAPLYIGSLSRVREMFMMLRTAGLDDPLNFAGTGTPMPQLSFATSSWWDLMVQGALHSTTPSRYIGDWPCGGSGCQLTFAYNEVNSVTDDVAFMSQIFGLLWQYDNLTGRSDRLNSVKWIVQNVPSLSFLSIANSSPAWAMEGLLYLPTGTMLSAINASDPRSSMPKEYWSLNAGRLIAGTGWGPNDTVFESQCAIFPTQDHERGNCGRFGFYYKGDYVTKGIDGYSENMSPEYYAGYPDYSNFAAYMNSPATPPSGLIYVDMPLSRGGQVNRTKGSALNVVSHNEMPAYVYQHLDSTGAYNLVWAKNGRTDVQHASREFFWVKPHYLAVYDRGTTGQAAFKKAWFIATGDPTINGKDVSWNSPLKKASAYLHSLLPTDATISNQPFESFRWADRDYSPKTRILVDAGTPTSVRFLNVLEAQDFGVAATGSALTQSTSGTAFDGAVIGNTAVLFKRNPDDDFTSTTYTVPSSVKQQYVTGLEAGGAYSVTISATGSVLTVTITKGGTSTADSAGVLGFSN